MSINNKRTLILAKQKIDRQIEQFKSIVNVIIKIKFFCVCVF